ncbi:MAG: AAA family ATPase [Candidatus Margulisiibacteriota bacterium]
MAERIFPVGVPVSGKELIDREREIKELYRLVTIGQSVVISSPRRFGKTSLVLTLLEKLRKEGYYVGMVDLFKVLTKREMAEKIVLSVLRNKVSAAVWAKLKEGVKSFLKHLKFKTPLGDFEIMVDLMSEENEDKLLEEALEFIEKLAKKYKKKMVFFFDEFSDIEKIDGEPWLKKMRAIFQHHKNSTYIFAGSQESLMTKIFTNRREAFYKFARLTGLGYLPEEATAKYVRESFRKLKFRLEPQVVEKILKYSHCHPYYVQLLCQNAFFRGLEAQSIRIPDVEAAYRDSLVSEKAYFEELWQNLHSKKNFLDVLEMVCQEKNPYQLKRLDKQAIYYVLSQLENAGVIKKLEEARYRVVDPLFSDYIKMRDEL